MKPSRRRSSRARKRGMLDAPLGEMFSIAVLSAGVIAGIGKPLMNDLGPALAQEFDERIHQTMAENPGAGGNGGSGSGLDFGAFESAAGSALEIATSAASRAQQAQQAQGAEQPAKRP